MPRAIARTLGRIIQYVGATNTDFTHGYTYECVNNGTAYKWVVLKTQPTNYFKEIVLKKEDWDDNQQQKIEIEQITKNRIIQVKSDDENVEATESDDGYIIFTASEELEADVTVSLVIMEGEQI